MTPEQFLKDVNAFEADIAAFQQRVKQAAYAAQARGEKTGFAVHLGDENDTVLKAIEAEWKGWKITYDKSPSGDRRMDFKVPNA